MGDVTDPGAVQRATAGAAMVVHSAAVISGAPEETMRVNAEGTSVLLEAAKQAGCERFLYMSTAAVYAFDDRAVVDESTPFLQEGPAFQLSRVRAEQAVWARALEVWRLRCFVPTTFWERILPRRGRCCSLSGSSRVSMFCVVMARAHGHVDNLVEAVITAAYTARAVGQAYNIVDGQTTGREYADRFCHWLGLDSLPIRQEVVPWRGRLSGAGVGLRATCVV